MADLSTFDEGEREFFSICDRILSDPNVRGGTIVNKEHCALGTIRYGDFEILEFRYLSKGLKPFLFETPWIYACGGLVDGKFIAQVVRIPEDKKDDIVRLLRSANPSRAERLVRIPHPKLVYPAERKGRTWYGWQRSSQDIVNDMLYVGTTIDHLMKSAEPVITAAGEEDINIAVFACGDGPELQELYQRVKNYPKVKIYGIDNNQDLLNSARSKYKLPEDRVKLIKCDLNNLASRFGKGYFHFGIGIGLFDTQVLRWDEGINILDQIRFVLASGAKAVFTSHGCYLFDKSNFHDLGFNVLVCSDPKSFFVPEMETVQSYLVENDSTRTVNRGTPNQLYEGAKEWHKYPKAMKRLEPTFNFS